MHPAPAADDAAGEAPREPPASIASAARFFVPLMFMAELMMISHAIITAFLARMSEPAPILAAYSISFHFHATLGSPVWACQFVALTYIRDRASVHRLLRFSIQVAASISWVWFLVSLTPVGDWFFRTLFGASPEVAASAKLCALIAFLIVPCAIVRSLAYALMMVKRRTMLVTYGTIIRLVGLAVLLSMLTRWFEGAVVGVIALFGCIAVETVYSVLAARRFYRALPRRTAPPPSTRELWKFSWPIMLMQGAESGVAFTVNFFLGRLPRPELALAAFAVLDSLMRVLLSPLRNLTSTAQTLVRSRSDMGALLAFSTLVALAFSTLMLLAYSDAVSGWLLLGVMGLPAHIAQAVAPALRLSFVLALCMAGAACARGLLIASRRTGAIAVSAGARVVAVAGVGVTALSLGAANGALIGVLALSGAFLVEAVVLGGRLLALDRRAPRLFAGS